MVSVTDSVCSGITVVISKYSFCMLTYLKSIFTALASTGSSCSVATNHAICAPAVMVMLIPYFISQKNDVVPAGSYRRKNLPLNVSAQ